MIKKVAHTGIIVSNMEKAISFYRDLLGLKLLSRKEVKWDDELSTTMVGVKGALLKITMLQTDDDEVELIQYVVPKGKQHGGKFYDYGGMHLAFEVKDINGLYKKMKEKGIKFHAPPNKVTEGRFKGMTWCYCQDPDGCELELIEWGEK